VFEFPTNFLTWADINYNEKFPSYTICHANINNINCYYFFYEISSMQYSMKTNKFTLPSTGNIFIKLKKGYTRTYTASAYDPNLGILYIGTSGGELTLYNIKNLFFKSAFSVI